MQEEVTGKTVALIVDGAKMSEQVFEKAVKKFLEEMQKSRQPKIYRGKQTLKQLAGQNAGLANIEISDKNIKAFTHVRGLYQQALYQDALRSRRPAPCPCGRVHEAPIGDQAHPFYRQHELIKPARQRKQLTLSLFPFPLG